MTSHLARHTMPFGSAADRVEPWETQRHERSPRNYCDDVSFWLWPRGGPWRSRPPGGWGRPSCHGSCRAEESSPAHNSRISYYCNGEIHVSAVGQPEGKPVTSGHWDFKPSWSKTGDMLVCFRRLIDDPVTVKWKTAIFVVQVDGSGFHQLSDGTHTDFNPTWTRDGQNTPIWNRRTRPQAVSS